MPLNNTHDALGVDPLALAADAEERRRAHEQLSGDLARLLREQAALRRVATLVARGLPPEELFAAVTQEAGQLLGADTSTLGRLDDDSLLTTVAIWTRLETTHAVGREWRLGGHNITTMVAETGRPARMDDYSVATGPIGEVTRDAGAHQGVATPVVVDGRVWGVMAVFAASSEPLAPDTANQLAEFTDLLAMAIADAESRAALGASRQRIVAAFDEARRRIERDLHDGAQQRLVSLGLELRAVESLLPLELVEARSAVARVAQGLLDAQTELREIARGIHPATLAEGGLRSAIKALARRSPIPVTVELDDHERLPEPVEVGVYYIVTEALANAARHAEPTTIHVELHVSDDALELHVRDDGTGGAEPAKGTGLLGMKDRVETLAGTIDVDSPRGGGTSIRVAIPLLSG